MEPTPMTAPKQPARPASEQAVSDEELTRLIGFMPCGCEEDRQCACCSVSTEALRARKAEREAEQLLRIRQAILNSAEREIKTTQQQVVDMRDKVVLERNRRIDTERRLAAAERVVDAAIRDGCYDAKRGHVPCANSGLKQHRWCAACLAREYRR